MARFIQRLKLHNKTMDVMRLENGVYVPYLSAVPIRFEGLEPVDTALRISDNIREKVMLITSNLMCDPIDLLIRDLLIINQDNMKFVCSGIRKYDEVNLSYIEVLMRQVESPYHETVELYRLKEDQPNYDPIFKQWADTKEVTTEVIKCLVTTEPLRRRGTYGEMDSGGQMITSTLLLIVDLPTQVTVEDKVLVRGDMYHIRRVEQLEYQTECLLEKILPSGREFPN